MIEVRLLGSIEARDAGHPLALGGHKQRAVLAILALHANEVVSLDRLIDGIWSSEVPRTASAYVHNCISRLRRALGPGVIQTVPPGYALRTDEGAIDVARFETLVREARGDDAVPRLELLTQALALWRGPALSDFAFDEFAQGAIQRLNELRFEAVEERIAAQLELGSHAEVIAEIEALADAHRSRERLRYLQMLALYRSGRQVDSLAVFQETRLALADELGLEPSESLKALERMILAHDPALEPAIDAPSTQASPAREARRTVTVLMVEPALIDDSEVEAARSVGSRSLAVAGAAIERHGGRVERLEGMELAGVFGLRSAHEDDALRAARAASEIRVECASLGIDVRSGIELGPSDVRGDDVDHDVLAAAGRVRSAAASKEILIGAAAFLVLSAAVEAIPTGEDGNYRLLALIDGAPAVGRRFDTEIVGRETELDQLQARVEAVWESAAQRSVVVLGEPGMGKTKLAATLVSRLRDRALVLTGRCVPYGEAAPYLPLATIVREAVGPGDLHRGIVRCAAGVPDKELIAKRLACVGSGEQPGVQSAEIFWAARHLFDAVARERPLLVVLDDAHWAEPPLLDLVEYLAGWCHGPVALLSLARPELRDIRPSWTAGAIVLERLSEVASRTLLEALPERAKIDDDAVPAMLDSADGNPLFLEQIAALAADRKLENEAVPPTLEALLASRLDMLPHDEREVLERAAVIGREFSREAVDALSPPDDPGTAGSALMALVRRRLVCPDRAAPLSADGFRFEHVLIRDAAYALLPKARRADTHERLARWLDTQANAQDEVVGFHLEQASRSSIVPAEVSRLGREAATRLGKAASRMIERLETGIAVPLLRRAVSLLPTDDAQRGELEIELGHALKNEGALPESVLVLTSIEDRARELGDRRLELRASVELAWPRLASGGISVAAVRSLADEALTYFEGEDDFLAAGRAARMRANTEDMSMQYGSAAEYTVLAGTYFRRAGLRLYFAAAAPAPFWVAGTTPVGLAIGRVVTALTDPDCSPAALGYLHTYLGELHAMHGCIDEAREHIRQAESSLREFAQSFALTTVWPKAAAVVEALAGDPAAAVTIHDSALKQLDPAGNAAWFATQTSLRAAVLVDLGRIEAAVTSAEIARRAAPADDLLAQITWRRAMARAYARAGRAGEAGQFAVDALDLARGTDAPCHLAESLLALAEVRASAGEPEASKPLVSEAIHLLTSKGNVARVAQVSLLR